jgi:hypothetical protein
MIAVDVMKTHKGACELWSVACELWSVACELWSVACELWSVACELWSVAWRVNFGILRAIVNILEIGMKWFGIGWHLT